MKTPTSIARAVLLVVALLFVACAPGVNEQLGSANPLGLISGFWRGLWHGIIAPITFIISLFDAHVQMYEVHNNGAWYNFGFLLGMGLFHGGGHGTVRRVRRPPTAVAPPCDTGYSPHAPMS